jgi:hypothetical protein
MRNSRGTVADFGRSRRWNAAWRYAGAACLLVGCGGADLGSVQGTVSWQGAPLPTGEVRLVPLSNQGKIAAAHVEQGQFSVELAPGPWRIEFSAPKVTGKQRMYDAPDSPTVDVVEELLPPRYNVQSELTLDVVAGSQEAKFDLQDGR